MHYFTPDPNSALLKSINQTLNNLSDSMTDPIYNFLKISNSFQPEIDLNWYICLLALFIEYNSIIILELNPEETIQSSRQRTIIW